MIKKNLNIQEICVISLMTAIICILSPFSIPLPLGVPVTLQTLIISLAAIILGAKRGLIATLIYILLGAFGLPIFSNFTGGWQVLVGPTSGFILSFPVMAFVIGFSFEHTSHKKLFTLFGIVVGNIINLFMGTLMFCLLSKATPFVGFTTCILPFVPITIIKIFLSWSIGLKIKSKLINVDHITSSHL